MAERRPQFGPHTIDDHSLPLSSPLSAASEASNGGSQPVHRSADLWHEISPWHGAGYRIRTYPDIRQEADHARSGGFHSRYFGGTPSSASEARFHRLQRAPDVLLPSGWGFGSERDAAVVGFHFKIEPCFEARRKCPFCIETRLCYKASQNPPPGFLIPYPLTSDPL